MPELPEIETLKNSLSSILVNNKILKFELKRKNLRYDFADEFNYLVNLNIISLERRARYLIIHLHNSYSLIVHLGMSGSLVINDASPHLKLHDHVVIHLACGKKLIYNDPRRFGMLYLYPSQNLMTQKLFASMGLEPLSDEFTADYFRQKIINSNKTIKDILLSNEIIVGVGNIYAAESLYLAKIHPTRKGNTLTTQEIEKLTSSIKLVLKRAIDCGGTSLRNFVDGQSKPGYFKQELLVYNNAGKSCLKCNSTIENIRIAGRSSYFCPGCQI